MKLLRELSNKTFNYKFILLNLCVLEHFAVRYSSKLIVYVRFLLNFK